ncbi:hypothetical protein CDV55_103635 [Aspergillus turcosus]|nr:hypothetical protein CDV55_103635 [Aspergillus turcosus]
MPSVEWSRVNQTNPSPYDQIFILSQEFINKSFRAGFPRPEKFQRYDKEAVNTGKVDPNNMTGQWIEEDTLVGAPQISINVEERNPSYLTLFILNFVSGSIHLRTTPPGAPSKFQDFSLQGWKLVFKTRIASKEVNKNDPKYNAYRSPAVSRAPGFRDTVFGLKRLYLDTSDIGAGAGLDTSRSSFNGATLPPDTLYNLKLFANEWLTSYDEKGLNILAHSLTKDDSTQEQRSNTATFIPSLFDYAAYPWLDPNNNTVVTDGLRENALGVLTYTDTSRHTSYAPPGLAYSGVFTDGGAAFCMNSSLFWNHYLLPILQEINQKVEVIPQDPPRLHGSMKYTLGRNSKHPKPTDRYFQWKQQQSQNGQLHWVWTGDAQKKVIQWDGAWRFGQEARSSTELSYTPGGREIHIKGRIVYDIHLVEIAPGHWTSSNHTEVEWQVPLRIDAVRDGGLQIVPAGKPSVHPLKNKSHSRGWKQDPKKMEQSHRATIAKFLSTGLTNITNRLAQDLRNLHMLFLPGRGVYRFGAPLINKRGDILAPLEYISVGDLTKVNKTVAVDHTDKAEADTIPFDEDLKAHFAHIPHLSEEYPEGEPVFDHHHVESDNEHEEWAHPFVDLNDIDHHHFNDTGEGNGEGSFVGPGPGPLAHVDLDAINEEKPPQEPSNNNPPSPPTNDGRRRHRPVFGAGDG